MFYLSGAYKGILYYVYPSQEKLDKLNNVKVWSDAATQIFYSLGNSSFNQRRLGCHYLTPTHHFLNNFKAKKGRHSNLVILFLLNNL